MLETLFTIILYIIGGIFIIFVIYLTCFAIFAVYACLKILDPIVHIDNGGSWFPDKKKKDMEK